MEPAAAGNALIPICSAMMTPTRANIGPSNANQRRKPTPSGVVAPPSLQLKEAFQRPNRNPFVLFQDSSTIWPLASGRRPCMGDFNES